MKVLPYPEIKSISPVGYSLVSNFKKINLKKKCRTRQFHFNFNFLLQSFSQSIDKIGHGGKVPLKKDPLRFWDPIRRIK